MRYFLFLCLLFGIAGCDGICDKLCSRTPVEHTAPDEFSPVFIDPETGKPLEFTPCGEGTGVECEIFKGRFQTVSVKEIIVIDSIRDNNTKCCRTLIFGGTKTQRCINVTGRCPPGWVID